MPLLEGAFPLLLPETEEIRLGRQKHLDPSYNSEQ